MNFDLPEGWTIKTLSECCTETISYGIVQPGKHDDNGVPVVRVNNFSRDGLELNEVLKVSPDISAKFKRTVLRGGEVLLTLVGSTGQSIVVPESMKGWNVPRAIAVIRVANEVGADWVNICLQSPATKYFLDSRANTTVQKTLNLKDVKEIPILLPPDEYKSAALSTLISLNKKLALNTQTNQILEQMAQAIFKSWFVDFDPVKAKMNGEQPEGMDEATASLFPEKLVESELGLIPEGWEVSTLSSLIQLTGGGTPKRSEETYWNGDIPWFSVRDVPSGSNVFVVDTDEKITELGLNKSSTKLLPKGTTIITARGTVGKLALVGTDMCMNQSCYGIRGKEVGDFYNYFNLNEAVSTLQRNTHGAVFDTITTKTFDTYSMPFGGVELANKFDSIVAPLLQKIEANVRQNIELSTLRDTLLPKLLSGEIELGSVATE
jgi:type I restriction enzyme, S subunit